VIETSVKVKIEMEEREKPKEETKKGIQTGRERKQEANWKKTRIGIPGLY
jgi:hypothetical protein